jgi:hypothetical protein
LQEKSDTGEEVNPPGNHQRFFFFPSDFVARVLLCGTMDDDALWEEFRVIEDVRCLLGPSLFLMILFVLCREWLRGLSRWIAWRPNAMPLSNDSANTRRHFMWCRKVALIALALFFFFFFYFRPHHPSEQHRKQDPIEVRHGKPREKQTWAGERWASRWMRYCAHSPPFATAELVEELRNRIAELEKDQEILKQVQKNSHKITSVHIFVLTSSTCRGASRRRTSCSNKFVGWWRTLRQWKRTNCTKWLLFSMNCKL